MLFNESIPEKEDDGVGSRLFVPSSENRFVYVTLAFHGTEEGIPGSPICITNNSHQAIEIARDVEKRGFQLNQDGTQAVVYHVAFGKPYNKADFGLARLGAWSHTNPVAFILSRKGNEHIEDWPSKLMKREVGS